MNNNNFERTVEIRNLPDFEVNGKCKNIIECFRRIKSTYWVIGLSVLLIYFLIFMPSSMRNYFWERLKNQSILTILVSVFAVVAVSLVWKTGQKIDIWIFSVFNISGSKPHLLDWTMLILTQFGSGGFGIGIAVFYFLRANHTFAYEIVLGTISLWLVVELLKALIRRPRPYIRLKNIRIVGSKAGGHSFPSGHTSQAFFLATLFAHYYQVDITLGMTLYVIALIVGITRMYVGMHYPRDVVGGAFLGTTWGLFGVIINSYFLNK